MLYKINKKEDIRHNIINTGILILNVSSELLVLIVSVFDVLAKTIGIGDLQYNLGMVTRLRSQSSGLMNDVNKFLVNNVRLIELQFKESEYMILDEPSAALDPISEDRIFEQLYRLSEGKSSVTISHRLSNTTLADKILVIDEGHIIEQGSHFELLKQNGLYAHLFKLQAERYQ